jgi:hypothetical protein
MLSQISSESDPTQPDHPLGRPDLVAEGNRIEREHIRHPRDGREGVIHYVRLGRVSAASTDTSTRTVRLRVEMNYCYGQECAQC